MKTPIDYQVIHENGQPKYAVVPYEDFLDLLETLEASKHYKPKSKNNVPHDVAMSVLTENISAIKAWRQYKKYTQSALAKKLDITQAALAQLENKPGPLRESTLTRVAKALGIKREQLDI